MTSSTDQGLIKALSTRDVFMAGVGLVVASSTLVSDFEGWIGIGTAFAMALVMAFVINLLLGLSAAELAVTYPKAGALYDYGAAAFGGKGAKAAITGIFLGFSFYAMFGFVGALETNAGAFGLRALFVSDDLSIMEESLLPWIIGMTILAVIPNLLGIQILARVELLVVVVMLAIRWIFGLFGYFGAGNTGGWSASNWDAGLSMWDWFGSEGVIAAGLIIAIWSFIGIEFVGPLAEETKDPGRMIPKGIVWGLVAILATSLFMGFGVLGTDSTGTWQSGLEASGCAGNCTQLFVGREFWGDGGRLLMAVASVLATFASMTIVYAGMPRILYGISRNGHFFGPLSRVFSYLHPRYRTPWTAIIVTAVVYVIVGNYASSVVDLIFAGAYVWLILYVVYHLLVIISRMNDPDVDRPFRLPLIVPIIGALATIYGIYQAFAGAHEVFLPMAIWILAGSLVAAVISYALKGSARMGG
ncbi:MAG: APC family permease [Actinomycetia bacterium]|nr:APC family permease [Actinomycetes bacterium]